MHVSVNYKFTISKTRWDCESQMSSIMANSKDGQGQIPWYLYKDLVTRNAQVQQESSNIYQFVMNNYYQQKGLIITRNIHVKYENSGTHCSKAISQVKSS